MDFVSYRSSLTSKYFQKITKIIYIFTATNFWFEDVELPSNFVKFNSSISKFVEFIVIAFLLSEGGALYIQDLTAKQNEDVILKSLTTCSFYIVYGCTLFHKEGIKELLFKLTVTLKEMFNDEKVERMMIRKSNLYLAGLMLVCSSTILVVTVEGAVQSLTSNATFSPTITIWPDLEARSLMAGIARVIIYIVFLLFSARVLSIYTIILTVSICLGHQFVNLCEYFLSLNAIFDSDESIEEQEQKYENAIKYGVKMHCITLNCVNQLQTTCHVAYSGQVVIIVSVIVLHMIQMIHAERTLIDLAPIVVAAIAMLISSGLFIWSAGDISFEAQRLPTAIFHSGWHNCRGKSSVRMRKTITIAMVEAQRPVVIKALGIIELSYESYVAIVKSAYSVFSVLY